MFTGAHLHLLNQPCTDLRIAVRVGAAHHVVFYIRRHLQAHSTRGVLIATGIAAAVADLSGDAAEQAVRGLPGVRREDIDAHKQMGDKAYFLGGALGVLALGGLVRWRRQPVPASATLVAVLATAFVGGVMVYTGLLGGQIRHTEVRPGATAADAMKIEPPRQRRPPPAGN